MDQTNPLAELTHKRRLSALGPGGLTRERAGFEVRDVHYSHYGRMCPIETPEGPNIGLITSLCDLRARQRARLPRDAVPRGEERQGRPTRSSACSRRRGGRRTSIAQANAPLDDDGQLRRRAACSCRQRGDFPLAAAGARSTTWTSRPSSSSRIAAALIPFLEHDDANRALMGSNMQRQAVPLLDPETPLVGTGLEEKVAPRLGRADPRPPRRAWSSSCRREIGSPCATTQGDRGRRRLLGARRASTGTG